MWVDKQNLRYSSVNVCGLSVTSILFGYFDTDDEGGELDNLGIASIGCTNKVSKGYEGTFRKQASRSYGMVSKWGVLFRAVALLPSQRCRQTLKDIL